MMGETAPISPAGSLDGPDMIAASGRHRPQASHGRVVRIVGMLVHALMPLARIGTFCHLRDPVSGVSVPAEVIGFDGEHAVLTVIGDIVGLSNITEVISTHRPLALAVGPHLLGRVLDPLGEAIDGKGALSPPGLRHEPLRRAPPMPLDRDRIDTVMPLGVRAIDGLLTIGAGQRIGIFGEAGSGKSSLLSSIVRGAQADVIVVGLVGERGREVREFIDDNLSGDVRSRSIIVVATSDRPAMERVKAAYTATAIAEYFRDSGQQVLLVIDSITRFARAQREIGLAAGEPPTRRGFPPSFFSALPQLLERAGPGKGASITGIYTVLTEGDGMLDPVAEETRSILDGHIVLSAELAQRDHFPAIDILASRSRVMERVADAEHRRMASELRQMLSQYRDVELLLRVGEYKPGSDPASDRAIARHGSIQQFLCQASSEVERPDDMLRKMRALVS